MVFPPGPIPQPDKQLDPATAYPNDVPFDLKQASVTFRRHRWFQIQPIGTPTGPYAIAAGGLAAGLTQRIQFDHRPDVIIVSISGQTALTGRCQLYLGEPGGPFILLGPLGKAIIPAPESGIITLVNVGTTVTIGTVVAIAGYDNNPSFDVVSGQ